MNGSFETQNKSQDKSQDKHYKKYLIAFFVILALPLLAVSPWFHPAAWGKVIVFRIIISTLVFFLTWQILSQKIDNKIIANSKSVLSKKNNVFWPFWLLIVLWAIFLLATIFSLDPYYSFWESPFRAGGFLNFSLYIIFAILAFLIIRKKDWQKIWNFALIIGAIASIMAILQYFEVFKKHLIPYTGRPPATFGNSIFLAIYLLVLLFLALSFGLKEKKYFKKILYFSVILLFIFVLLIIKSRATYFGLAITFLYFFLFYPVKSRSKKLLLLKIATVSIIFLVACGIYFLNTQEQLPEFIQNNRTLEAITSRLSFELILGESRFSTWQISFEAIKERPILGYGPENFSIAFDRYYDPKLPGLFHIWWDRAHNFILDISIEAGIPALIIYISLFSALLWQLQKIKRKNPNDALICHGIQTSFIGYLIVTFFNFDSFSTYLILFLLISYSMFLIRKNISSEITYEVKQNKDSLWKSGLIFGLFCILILFIWFGALKPLSINKEINWADYYVNTNQCEKAIEKMETNVLPSKSIIDSYAKLKYVDIIADCSKKTLESKLTLAPKAISVLKEVTEIRPYYTRSWLFLGNYTNLLIENSSYLKIKNVEELKKEADSFFEKANQLSPKHEEVFIGWIQTDLLSEKYQTAKEKAEQCINLNPKFAYCSWLKALSNIYLHEFEQADKDIATAIEKGHDHDSSKSLFQLHKAYLTALESSPNKEFDMKCYEKLAEVYKNLTLYTDPNNIQYYISLAEIYKILGRYIEAREQAILIVRHSKESQEKVKEFLDLIFSLDNNYFAHHFALAHFYKELNELEKSLEEALIAEKLTPPQETVKEEEVIRILEYDIWRFLKILREKLLE
ncbi:MAG: O-antigen ligase family protein [Candidatus Pacebacteria bacterium]|nr:O-antigen ligase family protein [Candidatus Paceibacterota bacterium]